MTQANTDALKNIVENQDLSTKKDLAIVKRDLEIAIKNSKNNMELKLADAKHELLKWLIGMLIAQTALIAGIMAYLK